MEYVVVVVVACLASGLTFFTGFGLGTLLLPAFSLFFPVPIAVALTACVHFLNGLFKLALVGRAANWSIVIRFGIPAMVAAFAGAQILRWIGDVAPIATYHLGEKTFDVLPVKLLIAVLMIAFALVDMSRTIKNVSVSTRWLPAGGLVSGFFGGISGHQGAFRSVFLLRAGLDKTAFIGTGVVIASAVDITRLSVYLTDETLTQVAAHAPIVAFGVGAAFLGAYAGDRLLKKVTLHAIQRVVAIALILVALALGAGII